MNFEEKLIQKLSYLINKSMSGSITEEEFSSLNSILKEIPEAAECYVDILWTYIGMNTMYGIAGLEDSSVGMDSNEFIEAMLKDEAMAPAVEIPKPEIAEIKELSDERKSQADGKKSTKFYRLYSAIVSVAAMFLLLFVAYANIFPPQYTVPVATVVDQKNVKWSKYSEKLDNNDRILTNQTPYIINEGLVEILYDQGVDVVIEGPAEFEIDRSGIYLKYGRLFSRVDDSCLGFSVYSPNSRFIDLGTEFCVFVDVQGSSELHVLKGKVQLVAGAARQSKFSQIVTEDHAMRYDSYTDQVEDIQLKKEAFARDISSDYIWRGQPIDLADIAGKGNGFGTGQSSVIIHPTKGYTKDIENGFITPEKYLPINENNFVDGIFVPHNTSELIVSSRGDICDKTINTSGIYSIDFIANPAPDFFTTGQRRGKFVFNGKIYGKGGIPCLSMHANIGITYDLDAIRNSYNFEISSFKSKVGIADIESNPSQNADFWVLVDGQVRYSLQSFKEKGVLNDVVVPISDEDRFLTLMTTDGGDENNLSQGKPSNLVDWCVFAKPVLDIK